LAPKTNYEHKRFSQNFNSIQKRAILHEKLNVLISLSLYAFVFGSKLEKNWRQNIVQQNIQFVILSKVGLVLSKLNNFHAKVEQYNF